MTDLNDAFPPNKFCPFRGAVHAAAGYGRKEYCCRERVHLIVSFLTDGTRKWVFKIIVVVTADKTWCTRRAAFRRSKTVNRQNVSCSQGGAVGRERSKTTGVTGSLERNRTYSSVLIGQVQRCITATRVCIAEEHNVYMRCNDAYCMQKQKKSYKTRVRADVKYTHDTGL